MQQFDQLPVAGPRFTGPDGAYAEFGSQCEGGEPGLYLLLGAATHPRPLLIPLDRQTARDIIEALEESRTSGEEFAYCSTETIASHDQPAVTVEFVCGAMVINGTERVYQIYVGNHEYDLAIPLPVERLAELVSFLIRFGQPYPAIAQSALIRLGDRLARTTKH